MKRVAVILGGAVLLAGCAGRQLAMPEYVTTADDAYGNRVIKRVDLSFQADRPVSFSVLKMCVAEHTDTDEVRLQDSSRSFVGAYTGNLYNVKSGRTVAGRDVFKVVDDAAQALIAQGFLRFYSGDMMAMPKVVKYDLKAAVLGGGRIQLEFIGIGSAMEDTGYAANSGFQPIGTWEGARPFDALREMEAEAAEIRACVTP